MTHTYDAYLQLTPMTHTPMTHTPMTLTPMSPTPMAHTHMTHTPMTYDPSALVESEPVHMPTHESGCTLVSQCSEFRTYLESFTSTSPQNGQFLLVIPLSATEGTLEPCNDALHMVVMVVAQSSRGNVGALQRRHPHGGGGSAI